MKKWTVVIEITDLMDTAADFDGESLKLTRTQIEEIILPDCPAGVKYQIMEIIDAPYGPQPGGVVMRDVQAAKRLRNACICRPGSVYTSNGCPAKVHRP